MLVAEKLGLPEWQLEIGEPSESPYRTAPQNTTAIAVYLPESYMA